MKRTLCLLLIALCLAPSALADGRDGSSNYLYNFHGYAVAAPPAYTQVRTIAAPNLPGVESLTKLVNAYVTEKEVYVLCAAQLLILDHEYNLLKLITSYTDEEGKETALDSCSGVTVAPDGTYYITQSEKSRILHFDRDHRLLRTLTRPSIPGFENVNYRPTKLVVDTAGRIYVISKGMYEGIVQLNPDGSFSRFFGVNTVTFTPWQLLWRIFATQEQRERQAMWLPSDFTNLCIDQDGFLFATLLTQDKMSIKRLNAKGENIIKVPDEMTYPLGDEWVNDSGFGIPTGASQFISVDTNPYGVYICLDSTRSRVFAYNEDHRLLFVFGGIGDSNGYFRSPADARFVGDNILVLDTLAQSLKIFSPTKYGNALLNAVRHQYLYEYETAAQYWQEALTYNPHLTLAYSGIGRKLLREGRYDEALENLRLGEDRSYYNKAYEKIRNREMRIYLPYAIGALAGLIVMTMAIRAVRRNKAKRRTDA